MGNRTVSGSQGGAGIATASVSAFLFGFMALADPGVMFATQTGKGAFYRIMHHNAMAELFGAAFLYALLALGMGLRYLDGGGAGCMNVDETPENDRRRLYHHLPFYGFGLCFASTSTATLYHYLLGREAPYPWWDLRVALGTLGGVGLVAGTLGLLRAKAERDPDLREPGGRGMEKAFTLTLLALSLTGLALLVLRATPAMGTLLAVHLGCVFGFFLTMPYDKFVHGLYRYAAPVRSAKDRKAMHGSSPSAVRALAKTAPKAAG